MSYHLSPITYHLTRSTSIKTESKSPKLSRNEK
jgi:hypothetical protein